MARDSKKKRKNRKLLSILKGDMSFVGPKPLAVAEYDALAASIPGFDERTKAVPGLTGLAQVFNEKDEAERKLELDLEYVRRMGPLLDLKLMVLSVRNTLLARWDARQGKPAAESERKHD